MNRFAKVLGSALGGGLVCLAAGLWAAGSAGLAPAVWAWVLATAGAAVQNEAFRRGVAAKGADFMAWGVGVETLRLLAMLAVVGGCRVWFPEALNAFAAALVAGYLAFSAGAVFRLHRKMSEGVLSRVG